MLHAVLPGKLCEHLAVASNLRPVWFSRFGLRYGLGAGFPAVSIALGVRSTFDLCRTGGSQEVVTASGARVLASFS